MKRQRVKRILQICQVFIVGVGCTAQVASLADDGCCAGPGLFGETLFDGKLFDGKLLDGDNVLRLKTFAGPVTPWADQVIYRDWRVQRNTTIGHCRLLDSRDRTVTIGSLDQCFAELQRRRYIGEIAPMPSHVVIVMHGLAGTRSIMHGLADYLREQGGLTVINFGYASTKGTIQEQAVGLESVIRNLEGVQEVSFVAHSQGNILIRHLLYKFQAQGNPPPIVFRRMVMIAPPNHGADIADTIGQSRLVQLAAGDVVDQFAPNRGWPALERQLATPGFEFGIIAGGRGNNLGYLPGIVGDDDGLISIQTHMLDGSSDFIQIGGMHQLMPRYAVAHAATLCFLQSGHFRR